MELTMNSGDLVALAVQKLWTTGLVDSDEPLLRIDYRREAKDAPFQFDMVNGRLHRSGCSHIPATCADALYGVWHPGDDLESVGCDWCRPSTVEVEDMSQFDPLDVLYGLISVVDQFGSVLKERGKEYRASAKGQKLENDLGELFASLDRSQRDALRVTLDSLDGLVKVIESARQNASTNGKPGPSVARNGNHRKKKERG